MVFANLIFIYIFLPLNLALYFCTKNKTFRNWVLIAFSMIFYAWGEPIWISLLLFSAVIDYCHGIIIEGHRGQWQAKAAVASSLILNLGLLGTFKYSGFIVENVNALLGTGFVVPSFALPIGISFYTFQTITYTVDVYRGNVKAQRTFSKFLMYVSSYHQLVAGPIVRYSDVADQIEERKKMGRMNRDTFFAQFGLGVERFAVGVGKKVIIANALGELAKTLYASQEPSVVLYWVAMAAFALQIYFDFAGYSDMAIGLGHMIGFKFPENFDHPFISQSITEFWRRWHMSLGGWFRDYVYIPLGGSRGSLLKQIRNIVIVWFLTGFWHGASWNFVLWGLYFGLFLTLEKMVWGKAVKKLPRALRHFYTLFLLSFSFVIFDTVNLKLLPVRIGGMLGLTDIPFLNGFTAYYLKSYALLIVISILAATPLPAQLYRKLRDRVDNGEGKGGSLVLDVLEVLAVVAMVIVCTAYIVDSSFNPFLYFRF